MISPSDTPAYRAAYRAARIKALPPGTCRTCFSKPSVPDRMYCAECQARLQARSKRRYQTVGRSKFTTVQDQRRAKGLCTGCGEKTTPGRPRCMTCRKAQAAYHLVWKARKENLKESGTRTDTKTDTKRAP